MRTDLYESITQQIILALEAGANTFQMPWHAQGMVGSPINAVSGRAYRGINTLLLWVEASRAGYACGEWATYRQWAGKDCQVRKGEKSTVVLLWKPVQQRNNDDEEGLTRGLVARAFHVFNAEQVEGYFPERRALSAEHRIVTADTFFAMVPASVWAGSDSAFFDPASDTISMPSFAAFVSPEAYYGVLAHELTHWTGVKSRLARDLSGRFGSEAYAMEELVAELGAAFVIGHLGLASSPRDDHAAYISSWLKVLRQDPRAIITAASRAQAAADYLINFAEPEPTTDKKAATISTATELEHAA